MAFVDNKGSSNQVYLQRFLFDMSFWIWVSIILFNVITGVVVDGFASLRGDAATREDILGNNCFVCGFTRSSYDDIPNFRGPTFDDHIESEHDWLPYLHYYVYLQIKAKEDFTGFSGVESYVATMIDNSKLDWIPVRTSKAIQDAYAKVVPDVDLGLKLVNIERILEELQGHQNTRAF
jgi:hypothetical protein